MTTFKEGQTLVLCQLDMDQLTPLVQHVPLSKPEAGEEDTLTEGEGDLEGDREGERENKGEEKGG